MCCFSTVLATYIQVANTRFLGGCKYIDFPKVMYTVQGIWESWIPSNDCQFIWLDPCSELSRNRW